MADSLANLVAILALVAKESITILVCGQLVATPPENGEVEEVKTVSIYEIDEEDWGQLLIDYLKQEKLPS